jgi:hypothetical protein
VVLVLLLEFPLLRDLCFRRFIGLYMPVSLSVAQVWSSEAPRAHPGGHFVIAFPARYFSTWVVCCSIFIMVLLFSDFSEMLGAQFGIKSPGPSGGSAHSLKLLGATLVMPLDRYLNAGVVFGPDTVRQSGPNGTALFQSDSTPHRFIDGAV